MPELLDQIRADMSTRLSQLRPFVEEHQRLQAALRALADVAAKVPGSAAPDSPRSFAPATRRAGTASTTAPTRARKRAARGANRQAVMRAVQERPGATSAQLAAVSGVQPSTLYALLTRLVKDGELQTRALPTGRTGYALISTPRSWNASK